MDALLTTIVTALIASVGALAAWIKIRAAQTEKRLDKVEEKHEALVKEHGAVREILAVYKACPVNPCPPRKSIAEMTPIQTYSISAYHPK